MAIQRYPSDLYEILEVNLQNTETLHKDEICQILSNAVDRVESQGELDLGFDRKKDFEQFCKEQSS